MNKKLLSIVVMLSLVLSMIMPEVMADTPTTGESDETTTKYGTVKNITNEDTKKGTVAEPTITGDKTANTVVTFGEASLKTLDAAEGRQDGYAWLGVSLTIPTGETNGQEANNGITKLTVDGHDVNPVENPLNLYFGINASDLENAARSGAKTFSRHNNVSWTINGETITQKVTVVVELAKVTLYEKNAETPVWTEAKFNEIVKELEAAKTTSTTTNKSTKKKDDTPKMGTVNVYTVAGLVAIVTLAGAVVLNKRK